MAIFFFNEQTINASKKAFGYLCGRIKTIEEQFKRPLTNNRGLLDSPLTTINAFSQFALHIHFVHN